MNNKKFGLPTFGDYKFKGETKNCKEGDCLTLYDIGRGHFTFHTNWFWASFTAYLPKTNRILSINLGDGIGTEYK
jgi:hypothetical protein